MSRYLGDTNILGNLTKPTPSPTLVAWMAERTATGPPSRNALDTVNAAVATTNECVMVTDNESEFPGIEVLNPLRARG